MIPDSAYFDAGLIPPGYGVRARTRQERQAFDKHERRSARILARKEPLPAHRVAQWEDWEIFIFLRVAKELDIAYGNPAWWAVQCERNRREMLAAWRRKHDYRSTLHPWKGRK